MKFRPVAGGCGFIRRRGLYVRESERATGPVQGGVELAAQKLRRVGNGVLMATPGTGF